MPSFSSITKLQWVFIAILVLGVICMYGGVIPYAASITLNPQPAMQVSVNEEPSATSADLNTAMLEATSTSTPTPTRTRTPTPTATPTSKPTDTSTPTPSTTPTSTPLPLPAVPVYSGLSPRALAGLELNPRAALVSKTTFFTSACFGQDTNPLQDKDFMAPADWAYAPERKCIFGYDLNPEDGQPVGRYTASGGPDGQPRFYIVPPEAYAQDRTNLKQLSQVHLIVDPEHGCDALGSIGFTADDQTYQCSACDFLRSGGVCPVWDSTKTLVLPTNKSYILDPAETGGTYGFVGFPAVIFRRGFSVYFTGKAGYAPPRTYFESAVDTFLPNVSARTTAEMSQTQLREIAALFESSFTSRTPMSVLAPLEQEAKLITPGQLRLKSRERGVIAFAAPPGTVLSSIEWLIRPVSNQDNKKFLETNFCLNVNGEEYCFTGVEDFAHCAFYMPCRTGYSSLVPVGEEGYVSTRYFLPGAAPMIRDGKVEAKFVAPDIGSVLDIEVKIRVRSVDANVVRQR